SDAGARRCVSGQWVAIPDCIHPPVATIAAPGRSDMVHDARRQRVYITTSGDGGQVLSYSLATQQFDPPLLAGGSFYGIDLSPDADQLVVADATFDGTARQCWVYLIDLTTGASRKIMFDSSESGTFTAVFTSDTEVLVTTNLTGSGGSVPVRRIDLV